VATKIKSKKKVPDILDVPVHKGDVEKFIEQLKKNPVLYSAVAGFILVSIVAGIVYRLGSESSSQAAMTKFARAVETEDPSLRATELETLAKGKGSMAAEALYMMGEAAFEAKEYDKAKETFERLRKEFVDSPLVPDAVEGLGAIAENAGQYDQAIASYKEVIEKWPSSFAKQRQQLNIARCQEAAGNLEDAVQAYKAQVDGFPGSTSEKEATAALDRLRTSNPDLFPKEEPPQEAKPTEGAATQEVSPAPALEAPGPADQTPPPAAGNEPPAAPTK